MHTFRETQNQAKGDGLIDPLQSVAFSVQANPGVYALLLGSGVSRSAGIPTGWDIVLDLLGKLAALDDDVGNRDLEEWFEEKYQTPPDYSKLLGELAKTPSERQQLLRPHFEPDIDEQRDGLKRPTAAHRAIAQLVSQGFVKVIVTTNFDRLLENALEDEGVAPTVLSTLEDVKGALPLVHTDCCVFKVHGDYRDPGILNTESELESYPPEFNDLLDRIFDEYGLIVCGWSAEWDIALRKALSSVKSRRFSTYWAARGELSDPAQRLVSQRGAEVIPIEDADSFFQQVQQNVESIDEYSKLHPLSIESAVVSLKRYLSSEEHRIQLSDHIGAVVEQTIQRVIGEGFEMGEPDPDITTVTSRLRRYESACETLLHMAAVGGYWANEDSSLAWERATERLATTPPIVGMSYKAVWHDLRMYPATLLMYALGLGALDVGDLRHINRIFRVPSVIVVPDGRKHTNSVLAKAVILAAEHGYLKGKLDGMETNVVPISEWIRGVLRQPFRQLIPDDDKYTYVFDKFEVVAALVFNSVHGPDYFLTDFFPYGSYIWRSENRERILAEIEESIRNDATSVFVESGILGETPNDCLQIIEKFQKWIPEGRKGIGLYF